MKILLAIAALVAATPVEAQIADFRKAAHLTVAMTDHGFVPATVTLRAGAPYVIRFVNRSDRGHDFHAAAFMKIARIDPRDQYTVRNNKVDLDPGQAAVVHLVAPTTPGARFEFHSSHLTDAASGLKGDIFVR